MRRTPEKKRKKNNLQTIRRAGRLSAAVVANEKKIAKTTGRQGVCGPPHVLFIELYSKVPEGGRQQRARHFHPSNRTTGWISTVDGKFLGIAGIHYFGWFLSHFFPPRRASCTLPILRSEIHLSSVLEYRNLDSSQDKSCCYRRFSDVVAVWVKGKFEEGA
jgi:hypothetical protein